MNEETGLVLRGYAAMLPQQNEMDVLNTMAKNAFDSPFFKRLGGVGGVLTVMLVARELDIPPMMALTGGIHIVEGRPELSARVMNVQIRKAGHKMQIEESTDEICRITGTRSDTQETYTATYSIEDAKKAFLVKPGSGWAKNPSDMLFARCISRLARRLFPDVVGNAYVEGEIDNSGSATGTTVLGQQQPKAEELSPTIEGGKAAGSLDAGSKVVEAELVEPQPNAPTDEVQPPAEQPKTTEKPFESKKSQAGKKAAAKQAEEKPPEEKPMPTDRTLNHPVTVAGKEIMTAGITQEQVLKISSLQKEGDNKKKIQGFLDAQKVTGLRFLTELEGKVILGLIDGNKDAPAGAAGATQAPANDNQALDVQIKRFWAIVAELGAKDDADGIKAMLSKMFSADDAAAASLHAFTAEELETANDFLAGYKGKSGALAVTLASMKGSVA